MTKGGTQMGRTQKCPNCGARAKVETNKELSPAIRDIIFQCTDFDCGARWGSMVSPTRLLRAPRNPQPGFYDIFPDNGHKSTANFGHAPPDHPDANGMAAATCG